jgi:hypothetical protein
MRLTKIILMLLVALLALGALGIYTPQETAHACLPCDCPVPNPPLNCFGPYTLFLKRHSNGTFDVEILAHDGNGNRRPWMFFSARQLAALPIPTTNTLIQQRGPVAFYRLAGGDFQINVGPDAEKKIFVMIFDDQTGQRLAESDYQHQGN